MVTSGCAEARSAGDVQESMAAEELMQFGERDALDADLITEAARCTLRAQQCFLCL